MAEHLRTAREERKVGSVDELYRWLRTRAPQPRTVRPPSEMASDAPPALAYVNHGRWVADCPNRTCPQPSCPGYCNAAMDLLNGAPYLCGCCYNSDLGGRWRPVQWPTDADRQEIERALLARPSTATRHWRPEQPVRDLAEENARHLGKPAQEAE